jgi:hypothetical protein
MESMDNLRERFKVSERETEELKHHSQALEAYTSTRSVIESLSRVKSYGWVMIVGGILLLLALCAYSAPSASPRTKGAKAEVALGPLLVDVPDGKGGVRTIEVSVPQVEVELAPAGAANVPKRASTPAIDVQIPENPARRARTPVNELDLPACTEGVARRARTPVVDVSLPETGDVARRVQAPAIEVTVPESLTDVPVRVRIPAMDVEVPSNAGIPRRVATPAIEVGLFDPDAEDVPTRVLVSVPVEAADEARRVRVPVSEQ